MSGANRESRRPRAGHTFRQTVIAASIRQQTRLRRTCVPRPRTSDVSPNNPMSGKLLAVLGSCLDDGFTLAVFVDEVGA